MRRSTEGAGGPLLQALCLGLFVALLVASSPQLIMAQISSSVTQVTESLKADPIIISVAAPPALSTLIDASSIVSTSWSQSKPYTGVSIAVLVDSTIVGQTPTADAYLTTPDPGRPPLVRLPIRGLQCRRSYLSAPQLLAGLW